MVHTIVKKSAVLPNRQNTYNRGNSAADYYRWAHESVKEEHFFTAHQLLLRASAMPSGHPLWAWKSLGFCPTVFPDTESIRQTMLQLHAGLDLLLTEKVPMDWQTLPGNGFCPSFNLAHLGFSCKEIREKFCRIFQKAFPKTYPPMKLPPHRRKKRIGFHVMPGHEGGFLRVFAHLLNALNKTRFDIFVFAPRSALDWFRQSITSDGVTFVPLGSTFEQSADIVRQAECDLIYYRKAGTDSGSYFFPFVRCAPVQMTSFGTHGTSGIAEMDYFLSSQQIEPANGQEYYTEKLITAKHIPLYQCRAEKPLAPVLRDEFGIPKGGAVYFCPHRPAKYHPDFDPILKAIADRDNEGQFVLLTGHDTRGLKTLHERLRKNLGDSVYRRLTFLPALPREQYLRLLSLSAAVLDSPVYAGALTAFDAFSLDVPTVTLSGPLHVQNFATGLYRQMGLEHFACRSAEEYVDTAVKLGTDPEYRRCVSDAIAANGCKIFALPEVIEEHEELFEQLCGEFAPPARVPFNLPASECRCSSLSLR